MMNERKKILEALISFEQPLEQLKVALSSFAWDADRELAFLSLGHVANLLSRFIAGHISEIEVEKWANTVEGRDDIGVESQGEQLLLDLTHELANPLLTQPLTRDRAVELLKRIE